MGDMDGTRLGTSYLDSPPTHQLGWVSGCGTGGGGGGRLPPGPPPPPQRGGGGGGGVGGGGGGGGRRLPLRELAGIALCLGEELPDLLLLLNAVLFVVGRGPR